MYVCELPGPVRLCAQVAHAAQEALVMRIDTLEEAVEQKAQACSAAETGRLQAVERERGSIFLRGEAFRKLKVPFRSHVCNNYTLPWLHR